jgi:hypothetical protein
MDQNRDVTVETMQQAIKTSYVTDQNTQPAGKIIIPSQQLALPTIYSYAINYHDVNVDQG